MEDILQNKNIPIIQPKYNDLIAIVPTYNEESTIASFILKLKRYAKTIILVDSNSEDETVKIAELVNPDYIITNNQKLNHDDTVKIGLKKAKEIQGKYITIADISNLNNLELIDKTIDPLLKNNNLDISFGIYQNIFDRYYKDYHENQPFKFTDKFKEPIKNSNNLLFYVFKKELLNNFGDEIPSFNDFINFVTNEKIELIRLNAEKIIRRSDIIITSLIFFIMSSVAFLIFIDFLLVIFSFSAVFRILPLIVPIFFVILSISTYIKYRRDLNA